jgi:hypothetical protein
MSHGFQMNPNEWWRPRLLSVLPTMSKILQAYFLHRSSMMVSCAHWECRRSGDMVRWS